MDYDAFRTKRQQLHLKCNFNGSKRHKMMNAPNLVDKASNF